MPVGVIPRSWPKLWGDTLPKARNVARRRGPNGTVMCLGFTCDVRRDAVSACASSGADRGDTKARILFAGALVIDQCIGTGSVNVNVTPCRIRRAGCCSCTYSCSASGRGEPLYCRGAARHAGLGPNVSVPIQPWGPGDLQVRMGKRSDHAIGS
jgi:hypothetical protein